MQATGCQIALADVMKKVSLQVIDSPALLSYAGPVIREPILDSLPIGEGDSSFTNCNHFPIDKLKLMCYNGTCL